MAETSGVVITPDERVVGEDQRSWTGYRRVGHGVGQARDVAFIVAA